MDWIKSHIGNANTDLPQCSDLVPTTIAASPTTNEVIDTDEPTRVPTYISRPPSVIETSERAPVPERNVAPRGSDYLNLTLIVGKNSNGRRNQGFRMRVNTKIARNERDFKK